MPCRGGVIAVIVCLSLFIVCCAVLIPALLIWRRRRMSKGDYTLQSTIRPYVQQAAPQRLPHSCYLPLKPEAS